MSFQTLRPEGQGHRHAKHCAVAAVAAEHAPSACSQCLFHCISQFFLVLTWARGQQVVVLAHSWGDNVWRTFMRWVTVDDVDWVERHLAAYVNIAGTVLGVSKSVTSLLSGAR